MSDSNNLREEFIEELAECEEAVSLRRLLDETSADDKREAKQVLRRMMDQGMITTAPGFGYKLASSVLVSGGYNE